MSHLPEPLDHAPPPPEQARVVFGDRLELAGRYADLLATTGISHGLIGPREAPRLWERHLVNCAVMHSLLPQESHVIDVGSGAGLPGIVLAVLRPDLHVDLVEPLQRRTVWLSRTIETLELTNIEVHRARAQEVSLSAPFVTARAVASLDKLMDWSFPLLSRGGRLLALKGKRAGQELVEARQSPRPERLDGAKLHVLGVGVISDPVHVIDIRRPDDVGGPGRGSTEKERAKGARGRGARKGQSRDKAARMRSRSS